MLDLSIYNSKIIIMNIFNAINEKVETIIGDLESMKKNSVKSLELKYHIWSKKSTDEFDIGINYSK